MDNKKIKNISFTDGEMNSIGYESLNEVFFDVFEIHSNGIELLKEKKGDFNGNPIIELDLNLENQIYKNVRFVLGKHSGVRINPKLLDHSNVMIYEETHKKAPEVKKSLILEKKVNKPKIVHKIHPKNPIIEEKNLIKESKDEFYKSIREELIDEIKREVRSGIIAELLRSNIKDNFDSFLKEESNQSELSTLFREENEKFRKELIDVTQKIAKREGLRFAESGGGTNAMQFANGGTMKGDLTVTGMLNASDIHSQTFSVDDLVVKSLSAENEVVTQNLNIVGLLSTASAEIGQNLTVHGDFSGVNATLSNNLTVGNLLSVNSINADVVFVNTLSTNNEFVIHNLSVTESISANNILIYDSLSSINSIYTNYAKISNLEVQNNSVVNGLLSANAVVIDTNLITDNLTANYATVNHTLSVNENLITNYETVNNNLAVSGHLYANQAAITNDLTIGGGLSSYNGSYILGNVIVTGNLTVSQEIFGDLVSGNTIVNSSGDTLLAKAVKNISGASFVNGNYTVTHNLSSYDLLLTLYYVNPNGTREVVHASMINDTLSTTQISFANQPSPSDNFKLIIMS